MYTQNRALSTNDVDGQCKRSDRDDRSDEYEFPTSLDDAVSCTRASMIQSGCWSNVPVIRSNVVGARNKGQATSQSGNEAIIMI